MSETTRARGVSLRSVNAAVLGVGPAAQPVANIALRGTHALRASLPQLKYRLMRVGPFGLAGCAALIAALVMAVAIAWPAKQAQSTLREQLLQPVTHAPVRGVSAGTLVRQLPTRAQVPGLLVGVLAQADKAGVALDQGHYDYRPARPGSSVTSSPAKPPNGPRSREPQDWNHNSRRADQILIWLSLTRRHYSPA